MVLLGSPNYSISEDLTRKSVDIPYTIPAYIPMQPLEMIDPVTKKKKVFTVENAEKLADLITKGWDLYGKVKGGSGKRTIILKRKPKPTTAGLNVTTVLGGLIAAYVILSLLKSKI
jgi:hypothetical protein